MRLLLVPSLLCLVACGSAAATPTVVFEVPTATTVVKEGYDITAWAAYDLGARTSRVLAGLTYGATDDFELGFDAVSSDNQGIYINGKWRLTEPDRSSHYAVGLMGVGPRFSASPNILYAVATFGDDDDEDEEADDTEARFHIGAYVGNRRALGRDYANILAGLEIGDGKWRGFADYFGGSNPRGMFSVGVGYTAASGDWQARLGYQYQTQARTGRLKLQLNYFTD